MVKANVRELVSGLGAMRSRDTSPRSPGAARAAFQAGRRASSTVREVRVTVNATGGAPAV